MRYFIQFKDGRKVCVENVDGIEYDSDCIRFYNIKNRKHVRIPFSSSFAVDKAYMRTDGYVESDYDVTIEMVDISELLVFAKNG